jgi:hypothetical protein
MLGSVVLVTNKLGRPRGVKTVQETPNPHPKIGLAISAGLLPDRVQILL